ncbi:hypothetical protein L3V86_09080 [Thiotrichales bacterium 19S11-10]|nr:hypothetical protein [Thiotrichales bacterium 19S11-10]
MFDWENLFEEYNKAKEGFKKQNTSSSLVYEAPYQIIKQHPLYTLRYYPGKKNQSDQVSLCIYSLINHVDILDFSERVSFIKMLSQLQKGVYVIEWQRPEDKEDFHYLTRYIVDSIEQIVQCIYMHNQGQQVDINVLGICQGGVFALVYSALFSHKIHSLSLLMTPIDSQRFIGQYQDVILGMESYKLLPREFISACFSMLKPFKHYLGYYIDLAVLDDSTSQRMAHIRKWLAKTNPQSISLLREYNQFFIEENALIKGVFQLGEYQVNLHKLNTVKVLNTYASYDQLVPPKSSQILSQLISSINYQEVKLNCGHIGIFTEKEALSSFINTFDAMTQRN